MVSSVPFPPPAGLNQTYYEFIKFGWVDYSGFAAWCEEFSTGAVPAANYQDSCFVKKTKAIVGRLEEAEVTNWMLSKTNPFAVHSFSILSSSSSVTVLVSMTL